MIAVLIKIIHTITLQLASVYHNVYLMLTKHIVHLNARFIYNQHLRIGFALMLVLTGISLVWQVHMNV